MVQLLAYDNSNSKWVNLDLQEDLSISLNKSIEEIQDITQRKTSYSKTFTIVSSDANDKFFRSAFNVNATDFNNKLQTDCVVQDGGNDVFRGKLRLNKVIVEPAGNRYEIFIIQEVAPFSAILKNFNICELDYDDIAHVVNYDNITTTWEFSGGSYTNYSGIQGRVLYPLAHTGYDQNVAFGEFQTSGLGSFTNSGTPLTIEQYKPWLNLKYMVDKVFDKAGFTYTSEFFNTEYFQTIFVLAGNNQGMGTAVIGGRPENQNKFLVEYQGEAYNYPANNNNLGQWEHVVYNTIEYDYLNQYRESGFPATGPGTGANWFTVPITGTYQFKMVQDIFLVGSVYGATYLDVGLRDIDSGFVYSIQSGIAIPPGGAKTYTFYLNAALPKNRRVAFMFRRQTGGGFPNNTIGFRQGNGATFELYNSPDVITSLGDIKIDDNLPCDVSGLDFIKSLITVFNLVVIPNGERDFLIEPWTNYLSSDSGTTYDWSSKLDHDSAYEITPLDFDLQRELHLTWSEGDDVLNDYYETEYNTVFGEKFFVKQSELLSGSQKIDVVFEPLPTNSIADDCTMVIPYLYKLGEPGTDPREIPTSCGLRLGFYCGMQHFYTGPLDTDLDTYYVLSGTTSVGYDTFPMVNHLSLLQEPDNSILTYAFSDLNFRSTYDFFMSPTEFLGYTPNTTYNYWYKPYIDLLYSDEARLFKGNFILTPEDISKIDFNDSVYFLNSRWRLYSINDGDITDKSLVECEFLKEPYRTSKVNPAAPNYVVQNTPRPAPGPEPTNDLNWYIENDLGSLSGNIITVKFEVYQDTTNYVYETQFGSGVAQIPSGNNYYNLEVRYSPVSGSMNNLKLTLGTSSGDNSYGEVVILQPTTNTIYSVQGLEYFPASGNIYATISTY